MSPDYVKQVLLLRLRFLDWISNHGEQTANIQFNFPPNVAVCATMPDALRFGLVSTNAAGRELIDVMCAGMPVAPTVLQVRAAIEAELETE